MLSVFNLVLMFMCFVIYSSVINFTYSWKQLLVICGKKCCIT